MTFHGVHGKPPQTWRHKTTEIYQLTILKARSLKSRCQQGHAPSKGSRKESALASSSRFPITLVIHSWLVATSPQSLPPLSHGLRPVCLLFFLFLDFFLMWIIFKVYMEFVKHCFCFIFCYLGRQPCGIFASQPGMEPITPASEGAVLTTEPPGTFSSLLIRMSVIGFKVHSNLV